MLKALSFAAIFLVTFGVLAARISTPDLYDPPPGGDERDYEALAYNLWKGRGFGYFWSDPEWRAPYLSVPSAAGAVRDLQVELLPHDVSAARVSGTLGADLSRRRTGLRDDPVRECGADGGRGHARGRRRARVQLVSRQRSSRRRF